VELYSLKTAWVLAGLNAFALVSALSPFRPIDVIWAVMIVWRIRVKIIRTVQCCVVYHNCTQL